MSEGPTAEQLREMHKFYFQTVLRPKLEALGWNFDNPANTKTRPPTTFIPES